MGGCAGSCGHAGIADGTSGLGLSRLAGQDDASEAVAVPVVPDVVAEVVALGAAALDLIVVDALVVRVSAGDLEPVSPGGRLSALCSPGM